MSRLFSVNEPQIKQCQTPEGYLHTLPDEKKLKKLGEQWFCTTCLRWKFKYRRCELFVRGEQ